MPPTIRAPRGTQITCRNWLIEAAYRMLQNNLDHEVAFDPDQLIVYGGRGKAARIGPATRPSLQHYVSLSRMKPFLCSPASRLPYFTLTLIAQSSSCEQQYRSTLGNPGKLRSLGARRSDYVRPDDGRQLDIHRNAGNSAGTYETLASLARQQGWESLRGKLVLSAGLGEMGGAQPLAITMNEGVGLLVEVDRRRAERRLSLRQVDLITGDLELAIKQALEAVSAREPKSIALIGNAAESIRPSLSGELPDVVTDQTAAYDLTYGYIPAGLGLDQARRFGNATRWNMSAACWILSPYRCGQCFDGRKRESLSSITEIICASVHSITELPMRLTILAFSAAYIRPLFCEGKGPFRWVALSGDPEDIFVIDRELMRIFPENDHLIHWLHMAQEKVAFWDLPARICWLGYGERAKAGLLFNELVAEGR